MSENPGLYDFPADHVGRKRYVSVQGHESSLPAYKTYKGSDGRNYVRPEYGGTWDGLGDTSAYYFADKDAYWSPLDGSVVEGRAAHREHMKRHDVVEVGDARVGDLSNNFAERSRMGSAKYDILRAISELS